MPNGIDCCLNLIRLLWVNGSRLYARADESSSASWIIQGKNRLPSGDKKAGWAIVIGKLKFHQVSDLLCDER